MQSMHKNTLALALIFIEFCFILLEVLMIPIASNGQPLGPPKHLVMNRAAAKTYALQRLNTNAATSVMLKPSRERILMAAQSKFISGHTHLISLLGKPIRHSASPVTHSVSFEKMGVDAVYLAFEVTPENLPDALAAMRSMDGWDGSNVTMPNKQAVIPYLDGLSDAASLIGAVNVIEKTEDNKLIGHNTDGAGFMTNLRKQGVKPEGATFTLLGPGGAGSAITVQAALDGVATIHVFAREHGPSYLHMQSMLDSVKEKTSCNLILHAFEDKEAMAKAIAESDVLINATNVGMGADCTDTPISADLIKEGMVVADAIYFPLHTQLLQDAAAKQCQIVTGIGMMNEQAAVGEQIWYGIDMPIDEVTAELNN